MERKKRKLDERIEKETNRYAGKLFYLMCGFLIVSLVVKCYFDLPNYVYALEIISLTAGVVCFLFQELRTGILFVKNKDDALTEIHNKALTKAMMVQFWVMMIGQCIPMILSAYIDSVEQYFWWYFTYLFALLSVSLIVAVISLKKGWLAWGGNNQEKAGRKSLAVSVAFGSLLYGVLTEAFDGFRNVYHDGAFQTKGILKVLGMAALWGVLFYFVMLGIITISGKHADKRLKEAGVETDEQGGMSDEE